MDGGCGLVGGGRRVAHDILATERDEFLSDGEKNQRNLNTNVATLVASSATRTLGLSTLETATLRLARGGTVHATSARRIASVSGLVRSGPLLQGALRILILLAQRVNTGEELFQLLLSGDRSYSD